MYSLSTCWNSERHTDGRVMLEEIRSLGFGFAELSHGVRLSLVPGILEAVDAGLIRISTLHNFCPLPIGVEGAAPDLYQFSSENPRERDSAFKHTLRTFDFAARLKASLVVLHMGSIPVKDSTDRLVEMVERGEKDSPRYQALCDEVCMRREAKKDRPLAAAYDLLRRLIPEAAHRGLKLGVENRESVVQIPLETDLGIFFKLFPEPTVCYWHDTGHAQIKENIGFIQHAMHLESFADRLAGFHVHDVIFPGRDHRRPGTGMVDFTALKPWVKPEHLKVIELSPSVPPEEVAQGFQFLQSVWGSE